MPPYEDADFFFISPGAGVLTDGAGVGAGVTVTAGVDVTGEVEVTSSVRVLLRYRLIADLPAWSYIRAVEAIRWLHFGCFPHFLVVFLLGF
jgi:hypothetical protein